LSSSCSVSCLLLHGQEGKGTGPVVAGLFRQEACDCRGIADILFVPEQDDANAFGLCHTAEVNDRDARHTVDRLDAVELERIDDEMKTIRRSCCASALFASTLCTIADIQRLPDRS
jgi:hypothetical protein